MRLSAQERDALRDNLSDAVWLWAVRLMDAGAVDAPPPAAGVPHADTRRGAQLARLAAITELQAGLERLATEAAEEAARYGADYPDLAAAAGTSRHTARRRWPGVAGIIRPPSRHDIAAALERYRATWDIGL